MSFKWVVHHPRCALALVALVLGISLSILPRAQVDFSLEQLYPQDSELAAFAHEHRNRFGRSDDLIFMARKGDPLHPSIGVLESRIQEIPGILSTRSPLSTEVVRSGPDGQLISEPLSRGENGRIAPNPLTDGLLIGKNESAGAVVARLAESHNHHDAREPIVETIEAELGASNGEWLLNGIPIVRTWFIRMMLSDLTLLIPLALGVSLFFFILSFRDWRHVLLGVLSVAIGVVSASAAYIATGTTFNVFTPTFIAVVAVVGTSDIIHLIHRFGEFYQVTENAKEAAAAAAVEVGGACVLTSLSTATGFLALLVTDIPPIRTFGLATGIGVMLTFSLTFLLVPAVLASIGPPSTAASKNRVRKAAQMIRLGNWVLDRPRQILGASTVLSLALGLAALQIHVDHRILEDIRSNDDFREAQAFMEEDLGAILPLQVEIHFDDLDPREPRALAAVGTLSSWLEEQPLVGSTLALPDLVQAIWQAFFPESSEPFPPSREGVAQLLLLGSISSADDPLPGLVWDGDEIHPPSTRIVTRVKDSGHQQTVDLVEKIKVKSNELLGPLNGHARVTGVAWLAQEVNSTLTYQFAGSFGLALAVIGMIWLVLTRSVRRTATALIPNLLPLLALLGMLGLFNLALKPSTAMVLSIGLGIAVDDTIHFLSAYEAGRREGLQCRDGILRAYQSAGRSILDTSVVLVSGFSVFAASEFVASGTFGLLTAATVVAALAADFFVLGPLLLLLDRRDSADATAA